jgi:hypothetical protein
MRGHFLQFDDPDNEESEEHHAHKRWDNVIQHDDRISITWFHEDYQTKQLYQIPYDFN